MKIQGKIFLCAVIFTFSFTGISRSHPFEILDTIRIKKILIASEPDYPPYCLIDKNGNPTGFSVELLIAAAKAVNIDVEIKIGLWNKIRVDLEEGTIDALPLMGKTPERDSLYDFTMPYLSLYGAVFVRKNDGRIKSIHDLKDIKILVMLGDNAEEYIHRNRITNNITTTRTFEDAFRMLASGEGDAVITQRVMGIQLLKSLKIKSIRPLDFPLDNFRQDFCFAVDKGNKELLSRLNEGLSIVIANKTFDEIQLKWFGPQHKEHITYRDMIINLLYIIIPLVIILSGISILILRREVKSRTGRLQQEIDDHQITELTLHKQQLLLNEMEKLTRIGGWEYTVATQEVVWTDGVYDIFGVSKTDFDPTSRKTDMNFYHPDDHKILDNAFRNILEHGTAYDLRLRINTPDGQLKWIRTAGQAEYHHKDIVRVYGHVMDITIQKQSEDDLIKLKNDLEANVAARTNELEEKVLKLRKSESAMLYMVEDLNKMTAELKSEQLELEAINKELEAFSYSISHDLRAPLRAINGFGQILQEDYAELIGEEGKRILSVIIYNTKRMSTLIDDLLSFSRISRQEIKYCGIDMQSMVNSILPELVNPAEKERISVEVHRLLPAYGDSSMLKQVWLNLISNALKFTSKIAEGKIEIGSSLAEGDNTYYVKDNGAGFNMQYSNKLFGVFQRLHADKDFEGTGVGLAIVKRIINRMGGRVWAEGAINQGAVFYFTLPNLEKLDGFDVLSKRKKHEQ
jgi:signal transduction histidine kinase/ABC-type amino acid transport substrate-binding protein